MDVEVEALNDSAGIDRRNKAIAQVQDWAVANGRTLEISNTCSGISRPTWYFSNGFERFTGAGGGDNDGGEGGHL